MEDAVRYAAGEIERQGLRETSFSTNFIQRIKIAHDDFLNEMSEQANARAEMSYKEIQKAHLAIIERQNHRFDRIHPR